MVIKCNINPSVTISSVSCKQTIPTFETSGQAGLNPQPTHIIYAWVLYHYQLSYLA